MSLCMVSIQERVMMARVRYLYFLLFFMTKEQRRHNCLSMLRTLDLRQDLVNKKHFLFIFLF